MDKTVKEKIWQKHKDDHKTEDYILKKLFEIDLPFWECKQNIYVEKDIDIDRFSFIILELVNSGKSKYSDIYEILGIDNDSFVNIQFNYLIKNGFLREVDNESLAITLEGSNFMNKKTKNKRTETEEFEFLMPDRFDYLKNDLSGSFFNPNIPIDKKLSQGKKNDFSGYNIIQSHKKTKNEDVIEIQHSNKPTYKSLCEKRGDFAIFYNRLFKDKSFYDFADSKLDAHKRNIRFLGLEFQNRNNSRDFIVDILQYNKSVKKFDFKFYKEEYLSKLVTDCYSKHNGKAQ